MVKQDALMESLSSNLHGFLNQIHNLSAPDKKFLRDGFIGLVRAGHPIVCQMARDIPNQSAQYITRVKRMDLHLIDKNEFDQKVKQSLAAIWAPMITHATPLILDLSDIANPLATQMDYLATVRDGSTGQLVNGYWLAEMYASIGRKNPLPILLEPFGHEQPQCRGQNPVVIDALRRVFTATEGRGVLVVDRGGDARVFLDDWLNNKYRFVVRMRRDRDLMRFYAACGALDKGQWIAMQSRELAERTSDTTSMVKGGQVKGS